MNNRYILCYITLSGIYHQNMENNIILPFVNFIRNISWESFYSKNNQTHKRTRTIVPLIQTRFKLSICTHTYNNNTCHILLFGSEYPSRGDPPIGRWRGYSDPNRKHMSNIFSCIFCHIPLYFKFFIFNFNGNLYHYNRNYFLTTAYELQLHS
jgi:hypothetical protein